MGRKGEGENDPQCPQGTSEREPFYALIQGGLGAPLAIEQLEMGSGADGERACVKMTAMIRMMVPGPALSTSS